MQNKLPEETINQIKSDSIKRYPCTVVLNEHMDNVERYRLGYIAGATEWAPWKVAFEELKKEADDLQRWKREATELLNPILDYGQGITPLGKSITEFVLQRAKGYAEMKDVHSNLKVCYEASIKIIDKQEAEHQQIKERCEKMETALKAWIELDKLKEGDGFQKGFELQTKALRLTDEALARTDGHNTESVNYIPGKGATLHEGIEKEGEDE
jgi:hypothetical protein